MVRYQDIKNMGFSLISLSDILKISRCIGRGSDIFAVAVEYCQHRCDDRACRMVPGLGGVSSKYASLTDLRRSGNRMTLSGRWNPVSMGSLTQGRRLLGVGAARSPLQTVSSGPVALEQ